MSIILQNNEDKFTSLGTGNRIATFLAYVSHQSFKSAFRLSVVKQKQSYHSS